MAIHRVYITKRARAYLKAAKQHLMALLTDRGLDEESLSHMTKIPLTTLKRWLDPEHDGFMPLQAAAVIAEHLKISVHDILPPDGVVAMDSERYQALEVFMTAPVPHVQMMSDIYKRMQRVMR